MFKNIHRRLDNIITFLEDVLKKVIDKDNHLTLLVNDININLSRNVDDIKKLHKTIESQQGTIEALTNALCEKYEHGFFVYLNDANCPVVINNGEQVTNKITTSLSIDWVYGELPNISTEQIAIPNIKDGE